MTDTAAVSTRSGAMPANANRLLSLLLAAAFVAILNETTMGVAIPHLIDDLHITAGAAQWLTTAFMLTMAVIIPTTGFLLQRFTTRQVFLTAITLFSLGTLIAFLAPGFEVLLVARVVQASGTAVMMPLMMTTVMELVPPASRGRFMGRMSIVMSLAPAIGPTMAGLILDSIGWRWIFGIVLPIAIIAMLAGAKWMVNVGEPTTAPLDVLSIVLSALGFGGIVFGLSQIGGAEKAAASADGAGPLAGVTLAASLGIGVIGLALFIWRQLVLQRKDDALLDLRVFLSRNFTLSILMMLFLSLSFFGAITVLPLYLQSVLGISALESGLLLLPGSLAMGLLGPLIGRIYDARGPRVLLIPGSFIAAAVLWFYTTLTAETNVWVIGVAQTLLSIGLAMAFTPLFTASLGSVQPKLYSHGSAVLGTVQQVAGAAGIALMITILEAAKASAAANGAVEGAAGAAGTGAAFTIAASLSVVTFVMSFFVRKPADAPEGAPTH
ncbi:MAG: DHA2 family efflux MFS transporter permease subunit [Microbacterium sp.]|jgi:DHA2 family lincomycin resistance protein-like MFS transporter|nr:DHA2 family efflux MFS transporter permease subunit [Microbacterium sp.]